MSSSSHRTGLPLHWPNFVRLHVLIDEQLSHIDHRLAQFTRGDCLKGSFGVVGARHVLAQRTAKGSYEVRESAMVAELGQLHAVLGVLLDLAADDSGDAKAADCLRHLAEHHTKDARALRALISPSTKRILI